MKKLILLSFISCFAHINANNSNTYHCPNIRVIETGNTFLHILARENLTVEEFLSRLQEFSNSHGAIPNPCLVNNKGFTAKQLAHKKNYQHIVEILTGIESSYSQNKEKVIK